MSEQAKALAVKFEAMGDAALKAEADARNIHGRHLIRKRDTFIEKLVAHDMQMAAIDPGAVEGGAVPQRTVGGIDAKREVQSADQKALTDTEVGRDIPPLKVPPKKALPAAPPAPPPPMKVVPGQQYVVRKDFPVHTGFSMTTLAKGSVVELRTYSKLQQFVDRGLKLRRVAGANHGLDRLGVQQVTTPYGGDDEDDLDDADAQDNGVDMRAFMQLTNDLSRAHTKIAVLEGERNGAQKEAVEALAERDAARKEAAEATASAFEAAAALDQANTELAAHKALLEEAR